MKKVIKLPILIIIITLTALIAVGVMGFNADKPAYAYTDPLYSFSVSKYSLVYDIGSDCNMSVTEDLTIKYTGVQSTGFIRDIPVNGGAQVRNVSVYKLIDGAEQDVWYDVYSEDSDFISVDIGDSSLKRGKSESYRIKYDYIITNSVVNKNMLPLNAVGHGWDCYLNDVSVKLILPEGFVSAKCYIGRVGTTATQAFDKGEENGRKVLTASIEFLDKNSGVTFDLTFEEGAIKNYTDLTPFIFTLAAAIIAVILAAVKFAFFNKNFLTPVVNYEAPDKMDPLLMGKLIDNSVNNEDVTSLIFYWASKGYIKINLDDKNDPALIRVTHALPEPCPSYQRLMYNSLFANGDMVQISQLKYKFYSTVQQVTSIVNRQTKGLYNKISLGASIAFSAACGFILGLAPFLLALLRVSTKMLLWFPFIAIAPMVFLNVLAQAIVFSRHKLDKKKMLLSVGGIALVSVIFGVFYVVFVTSGVIGIWAKIALYALCCAVSVISPVLITRTRDYTEKLNDIIGFKNFITLAEKNQLEMMLEQDPQFYYHILPYAQVLGVTDKWENKFKGLTVEPPQWLSGSFVSTYIEFSIINSMIRSSFGSMSAGMVSRPSSSGSNGGGRGGFGGGFSGGGFGGGGGRGR